MAIYAEIYVVTPTEYQAQLSQFVVQYASELLIEIVPVTEMIGSADAIRAVSDRIRGDFIVFNSDTLSQINLGELVHAHRLQCSDVTMLLSAVPLEESDKKGASATLKVYGLQFLCFENH
jgi:NDP-sugar pyrophosphorylase family protein